MEGRDGEHTSEERREKKGQRSGREERGARVEREEKHRFPRVFNVLLQEWPLEHLEEELILLPCTRVLLISLFNSTTK